MLLQYKTYFLFTFLFLGIDVLAVPKIAGFMNNSDFNVNLHVGNDRPIKVKGGKEIATYFFELEEQKSDDVLFSRIGFNYFDGKEKSDPDFYVGYKKTSELKNGEIAWSTNWYLRVQLEKVYFYASRLGDISLFWAKRKFNYKTKRFYDEWQFYDPKGKLLEKKRL